MDPIAWLSPYRGWLAVLGVASLVMLVASLVALPLLVARMPEDYFGEDTGEWVAPRRWTVQRIALRVLKNVLGAVLLLAGIAMLVLPGQGLLAILVALSLLDFPGKRALELWILRRRPVRRAVAWLRERAGRPPLIYPDEPPPQGDSPPSEGSPQ